jgi:succinyl-CoA synthetase beta subunit
MMIALVLFAVVLLIIFIQIVMLHFYSYLGMDIEAVAEKTPERIFAVKIFFVFFLEIFFKKNKKKQQRFRSIL